ncbi:hypothetical protein [Gemmobacter sp. 24YEA27]|uniref:ABC transporter permease n=1 Tax=Gemmobacter sp. 24YEA27 TaxID=3040672 RepID=UPI0032C4079C
MTAAAPIATAPADKAPSVLRRLMGRKLALFGFLIIVICVGGAVFANWLAPFDPNEQFFDGLTLEGAPLPPGPVYWFGTDLLGRDLLSRLLYGAQTSLIIGLVANGAALFIGTLVGVTAGYFRGSSARS